VPIAATRACPAGRWTSRGWSGTPTGAGWWEFAERLEPASSLAEVERLGVRGAEEVLARGAQAILSEVLGPGGIPES
jgi:heme oxygenase